eukprot:CFRG6672T1
MTDLNLLVASFKQGHDLNFLLLGPNISGDSHIGSQPKPVLEQVQIASTYSGESHQKFSVREYHVEKQSYGKVSNTTRELSTWTEREILVPTNQLEEYEYRQPVRDVANSSNMADLSPSLRQTRSNTLDRHAKKDSIFQVYMKKRRFSANSTVLSTKNKLSDTLSWINKTVRLSASKCSPRGDTATARPSGTKRESE